MEKTVQQSQAQHVQIVLQKDMNGYKRLFGGRLMEWIDVLAAVVSRRHAGAEVTTASVDNLRFTAPAMLNDTIVMKAKITYVGNTSMEVKVDTYVENMQGNISLINTAYVVTVAVSADGSPIPVPRLKIQTEEEQKEWEAGARRHALRKTRKTEQY